MELNKSGFNAFVLKYRVGQGETVASRDLIAAVNYIQAYAAELEVAKENYSLWGEMCIRDSCKEPQKEW